MKPIKKPEVSPGKYDLYPSYDLGPGKIMSGYGKPARIFSKQQTVIIDGYIGVFWEDFRKELDRNLKSLGVIAKWHDVTEAMLPPDDIKKMIEPFLGGDDPLFGTRFPGELSEFFDIEKLKGLQPDKEAKLNIIYGCGAALAGWEGLLVYVDLPKDEIQFRAAAQSITNLGAAAPEEYKPMYKRFYFVDWFALNRHKQKLLPEIDWFLDSQHPEEPLTAAGADIREALEGMARNFFRVRPWFGPGPWGGQWMKEKFPGLNRDVVNLAWSFELILPENGQLYESDGYVMELSGDLIMFQESEAVLGFAEKRFGCEFPIRFDYLDTFDGGNLSIQVHPRPGFIKENFGENFTQDETYYIMDCTPDARVYLGFQGDIDPAEYRAALEKSYAEGSIMDADRYVNSEPCHKHDLFLIPGGTIHGSGKNSLVLEISATTYIFTFKMYDWQRMDLNGKPRDLNIDRAFDNLFFERCGDRVRDEHVSKPDLLEEGEGWKLIHLPTHRDHFYDIHRFDFSGTVEATTNNGCHVLNLVEGKTVLLETAGGMKHRFSYAETFIVPAAAGSYKLTSEDGSEIKVIKAFIKEDSV